MSEQFTKGPWLKNGRLIYSRDAVFIATASKTDIEDFQQIESNAALIACAPEMYALLNEISDGLLEAGGYVNFVLAKRIEELLAKARGRK